MIEGPKNTMESEDCMTLLQEYYESVRGIQWRGSEE